METENALCKAKLMQRGSEGMRHIGMTEPHAARRVSGAARHAAVGVEAAARVGASVPL